MFPTVMLVAQRLERRGALVRRPPGRRGADADRRADGVPVLPDADPDVGDDGDLHADDGAARGGLRRPDRRRCSTPTRRWSPPAEPVTDAAERGDARARRRRVHLPRRRRAGAARHRRSRRRPGQTTAIIGSTGAGKTHAGQPGAAALRRHRRQVRVDGVDVRDLDPELLWSRIGLVPQKAYLFSGTVASQPAHGKPDATDEELWAGARDRPGRRLRRGDARGARRADHPGRHQRLRRPAAAARDRAGAGPHAREIYLFDDSFSALDLATDARLRAALAPVTTDATVVIVAQRVSTIRDADQILVLEDGARRRPRHARRAARDLPDLPGDRRVPAERRRRRHDHPEPAAPEPGQLKETERVRPAAARARRPVGRRHGRPEVADLRAVGQAARGPDAPRPPQGARRRCCSPWSASRSASSGRGSSAAPPT